MQKAICLPNNKNDLIIASLPSILVGLLPFGRNTTRSLLSTSLLLPCCSFDRSSPQRFSRRNFTSETVATPLLPHTYIGQRWSSSATSSAPPSTSSKMTTPSFSLYPPIQPYETGRLKVSDIHDLYYEQVGNPQGNPAVVLHGGPGGGCEEYYRCFFDPTVYRVVLFDQRGAGKSTPHAELKENTTWDLVDDIEKLRQHLNIDKWVVFGGSWGSTLALAYAETHPERVKALVLRGIFTLRRSELLWFYQEGASWVFPDFWEKYLAPIPEVERGDLMSAYYRRLTGDDIETKLACAHAWSEWEMATARLYVDPETIARASESDEFCLAFARIECHYFVNGGFFKKDGQLILDADKLKNIPGTIVQGRYDMVCPAKSAWDLHKAWSSSDLVIIPDAGHSARELGTTLALLKACEKYKNL